RPWLGHLPWTGGASPRCPDCAGLSRCAVHAARRVRRPGLGCRHWPEPSTTAAPCPRRRARERPLPAGRSRHLGQLLPSSPCLAASPRSPPCTAPHPYPLALST